MWSELGEADVVQISGVKEYLRENEELGLSDEEGEDDEMVRPSNAPTLLLGLHQEMTMDELLDGLPARPVVDRVVAMFVGLNEPTTGRCCCCIDP